MIDMKSNDSEMPQEPHYSIATANGWGAEMLGTEDMNIDSVATYAGTIGELITNITVEGADIVKTRVRNKRGKWLAYHKNFDNNTGFGDGTPITGIEIVGAGYVYAVHVKGGMWLPSVSTSDVEGEVLTLFGSGIDAIWIDCA